MKTMTCKQLGGACEIKFHANTFEEISEMSKNHGMEMIRKGDEPHLEAIKKMQELMNAPGAVDVWIENKRKEFDMLPENK